MSEQLRPWIRRGVLAAIIIAAVVIGAAIGYGISVWMGDGQDGADAQGATTRPADKDQGEEVIWTCSMHPSIRRNEPGQCPICGMDLVRATSVGGGGDREFVTTEAGKALMDIATSPVERRTVTAEVRMVGKVAYDETRLKYITAWVPGRLDRLFVDYTGVSVRKGDHMVEIYSPELLSAQEEMLQAKRTLSELEASDVGIVQETSRGTLEAAREKLRLWGLSGEQIRQIEQRGEPAEHITINAPVAGIVVHKNAQEGMYVQTGTRIYTIADLTQVWVKLDAYESDLSWLHYGQEVTFASVSYPGETFRGRIAFIDPILDPVTRTVKVRVNASNANGRLKPGMFVKATVHSRVAAGGKVLDPELAGKWICPMHPSVVREEPGDCNICGMPLVTTESLGYVTAGEARTQSPLVIPDSAPLITGTRAVVYVEKPDADKPTYEGREIVLGPRAGDFYIVRSGLKLGERVVTRGNFKIDSALQIQAKPSMMSPAADRNDHPREDGTVHETPAELPDAAAQVAPEFRRQLAEVFEAYFETRAALADDDYARAMEAVGRAAAELKTVEMELLSGPNHDAWMQASGRLQRILADAAGADEINALRGDFMQLSEQMTVVARRFGLPEGRKLYRMHCPMAFEGQGANWLQTTGQVANPYFGENMPRCGSVTEVIGGAEQNEQDEQEDDGTDD